MEMDGETLKHLQSGVPLLLIAKEYSMAKDAVMY